MDIDIIEEGYENKIFDIEMAKHINNVNILTSDLSTLYQTCSNESYTLSLLFNGVKVLTGFKRYTKLSDFVVERPSKINGVEKETSPSVNTHNVLQKEDEGPNTPTEEKNVKSLVDARLSKLITSFKRLDKQFESRWLTSYSKVMNVKTIANINKLAEHVNSSTQLVITSELVTSLGNKKMYGPLRTFATKSPVSKDSILKPTLLNSKDILNEYVFKDQDIALLEAAMKSILYKISVVYKVDGEVSILVAQPFKSDGKLNLLNAQLYNGTLKTSAEKTMAGTDNLSSYGIDHTTLKYFMSITIDEYKEYYDEIIKEREILNGLLSSEFTRLEPRYLKTFFWYINAAYMHNTRKMSSMVLILRDLKSVVSKINI